jgi:hypothetical protein
MAGYNTTIIPVSFAPGGTVYINASSTGNTVVINPGTPSNTITAVSTAGVLTPAMLLATSYSNAIATAASSAALLYQTMTDLSANVLTLTSNNSTNFGGLSLGTLQSQITGNAATAYANAIANSASLYAPLSGSVFTGPVSGITTLASGNTTITGFANVSTTLQVGTNTATFGTAVYHVANGNMGIGTASPAQQLAIGSSTDQIGLGASGTVATLYFGAPSTGSGGIAQLSYSRSTGSLSVIAGGVASPTTAMTVISSGLVGIGTTSPVHPLHVAGNTFITGSVGIGTSVSASQSLAVSRNITGGTSAFAISQNGSVQGDVTAQARGINNTLNVASANTFTLNQYMYYSTSAGRPAILNTTINSAYIFFADAAATAGISSYGFFGNIPAASASTITNVSLTSNVVTITTSAAHSFWPGQNVIVAATATTSINGSFTVLTSPSTTTFTYALVLADIVSVADTGTATVNTGRWNTFMQGTAPNYFAGQVAIGTTNLTNGYLIVSATQSSAIAMVHIAGTNQWTGTTPIGLNNSPTLIGTSAMTTVYGILNAPVGTFAAGATVGTYGGINIQPTLNSATTPTSYWGAVTQMLFGAAALGGTITNVAGYASLAPTFNAATNTNITTYSGFRASTIANGASQSISNIYAFYGLQNTTASSNAYNLYMSGTAKNYLAGNTGIGNTMPDATLAVTGTANVSGVVNFGSTLTTAGSITSQTATGRVLIQTDSGGSISLGRFDGVSSAPYIDFNSGATAVDYDARISVGAGNGTVGAATLTIAAGSLATGNTTVTGFLTTSSYSKTTAKIVGSLVAAATAGAGARSFVTDSTVAANGNFGAIVAGTGANPVPVYSDGTNWRIG